MTDHEHISELLGAYAEGALDPPRRTGVDEHLATCEGCRRELEGLRALRASEGGLSELERTRLHRDVLGELGLSGAPVQAAPRWSAAGRLVGVAATLVLLLGGLVYLGGNLGGDDGGDGDSAQSALEDAGAGRADPFSAGDGTDTGAAAGEAGTTMEADAAAGPPPEPTYDEDLGTVTDKQLKRTGRAARPFSSFAAVPVETGLGYRGPFLDDLVAQASNEVAGQLRDCARDVLAQLPTAVATYAAPAEYGDPPRPVLIVGFAYSFTEDGFLDQYQMWIYPRGSCDFPTNYLGGRIRP